MLTQITHRINRFIIVLMLLLVVLSMLVIFVLTNIFSSLNKAKEIDQKVLEGNSVHIIESKLEQAQEAIDKKGLTPLDLH